MRPPLPRALRALLAAPLVAVVLVGLDVASARPAGADGAGPTNFESVVDSVEPPADGVRVEVVGADSFLRVRAEPGTLVEIPGYDGEPYLRIDDDGSVHRNERSPATYLNTARDGSVALPDDVSSEGEPRWVRIGDNGEVAWHDHRIHWMISQPPTVGADRLVQDWSVPIVVDGAEVTVSGRLLLADDEVPWAAAIALLAAVGAGWLGSVRPRTRAWLLAGAAAVAVVVSVGAHLVNPPDAAASVVPILLPALALVLSLGSLAAPESLRPLVLPLAAVAALVGWAIVRIDVLWKAFVPSTLPGWVDRVGTALVLGVAVGVAAAILIRPSSHSDPSRAVSRPPRAQNSPRTEGGKWEPGSETR